MSRDPVQRLDDMIDACRTLVMYALARREWPVPLPPGLFVDAAAYQLHILGEAANRLPPEVRALDPGIEWARIIGMRNVLSHAYHAVDPAVVEATVEQHVPVLLPRLEALRATVAGQVR